MFSVFCPLYSLSSMVCLSSPLLSLLLFFLLSSFSTDRAELFLSFYSAHQSFLLVWARDLVKHPQRSTPCVGCYCMARLYITYSAAFLSPVIRPPHCLRTWGERIF